ncbi:hypothetical protein [Halomonas sp. LBP4]|uniref:hypothetical protein n=1 Tax=Halomonas sp. LBP4 TaxID=2044917 RepID=UPI000D766304|nr:hypothetical protein [Halomonas sp. LBP4]PXX97354.1 hypothetical protein CR157_11515 [Halomonas sp. LBP4]
MLTDDAIREATPPLASLRSMRANYTHTTTQPAGHRPVKHWQSGSHNVAYKPRRDFFMRYDGIGMGGPGGFLVMLLLAGLVLFMVVGWGLNKKPRLVESIFNGPFSLVSVVVQLTILAIASAAITLPVSGILSLDASETRIAWGFVAAALYFVGRWVK